MLRPLCAMASLTWTLLPLRRKTGKVHVDES